MISIMFHSAGLDRLSWFGAEKGDSFSDSLSSISMKLKVIYDAGFRTVEMAEAVKANESQSKKIFLTFDDGYLDNWVHIFPLLEQYKLKATIFVTPEFVDPRAIVRSKIAADQIDDSKHKAASCCTGFLSWCEMREMEKSGLVDIQCHAMTHTWYFKGPRIVDFWHPGSATERRGPVWMLWNRFPKQKPFYLTNAHDLETEIPYGTPIYEHGKSLETRRYFPNDGIIVKELQKYVLEHGGSNFFNRKNWRTQLLTLVKDINKQTGNIPSGYFESDEQYYERIRYELSNSKKIIEHELQKSVNGLCWPGGGVNEKVVNIARELGFRYFTLPSQIDSNKSHDQYRDMIPRIGSMKAISLKGISLGIPTSHEYLWYINQCNGSKISRLFFRLSQLLRLTVYIPKKIIKLFL